MISVILFLFTLIMRRASNIIRNWPTVITIDAFVIDDHHLNRRGRVFCIADLMLLRTPQRCSFLLNPSAKQQLLQLLKEPLSKVSLGIIGFLFRCCGGITVSAPNSHHCRVLLTKVQHFHYFCSPKMAVFIHCSIQHPLHAIEVFVHSYRHVDKGLDANDCGGAQINRQTLALSTFGKTYTTTTLPFVLI